MNVLIVHAHHEPQSFSSALKDVAVATFSRLGHTVAVSDLYAMDFEPVSDRRNFTTVANAAFLKQQIEETHASKTDGFTRELSVEMEKVLAADLLVFNFPIWWFGLPAILKGWVDRVFAYGKMYGDGKLYENGIGRGKRALVTMTTGSPATSFDGFGYNPSMSATLAPVHHGIFWFNGFAPLPPFIAYAVSRLSHDERTGLLESYDRFLSTLDARRPMVLPPLADFAGAGVDRLGRWMIEARGTIDADRILEMERDGIVLAHWAARDDGSEPRAWFVLRAEARERAEAVARALGLDARETFSIRELARPGVGAVAVAAERAT